MVLVAVALTVTVRSLPGFGGSGENSTESIRIGSVARPRAVEMSTEP